MSKDSKRSEIEGLILEYSRGEIGLNDLESDTNLFEAGLDSLMAVTLIQRIEESFDVQLSVISIFEIPNVRGLTELVLSKLDDEEKAL